MVTTIALVAVAVVFRIALLIHQGRLLKKARPGVSVR